LHIWHGCVFDAGEHEISIVYHKNSYGTYGGDKAYVRSVTLIGAQNSNGVSPFTTASTLCPPSSPTPRKRNPLPFPSPASSPTHGCAAAHQETNMLCRPCPLGTASGASGAESCQECDFFEYSDQTGATTSVGLGL
jgi:hypothetical protein